MKRSYVIIISIAVVVVLAVAGVVYALSQRSPKEAVKSSTTATTSSQQAKPSEPSHVTPSAAPGETGAAPQSNATTPAAKAGYYGDYTDARAMDRSYDKTILFFHAPWCSECRAFEKAIQSGTVPAGVQILKVDYDKRQDLRQKYGVRTQSTFVKLDDDDDQDNDHDVWVGYGKDKSIDAILRNL